MPTSNQSGTQSAAVGTLHTLGTVISAAGTFVLFVDTASMANGDELELSATMPAITGGAAGQIMLGAFANVQPDPIKMSVPIPSISGALTFKLKQTAGVARSFPWNIVSL